MGTKIGQLKTKCKQKRENNKHFSSFHPSMLKIILLNPDRPKSLDIMEIIQNFKNVSL